VNKEQNYLNTKEYVLNSLAWVEKQSQFSSITVSELSEFEVIGCGITVHTQSGARTK
jgi:hypothetical protein